MHARRAASYAQQGSRAAAPPWHSIAKPLALYEQDVQTALAFITVFDGSCAELDGNESSSTLRLAKQNQRHHMRSTAALLLAAIHFTSHAAPLPSAAKVEVIAVLERLAASGCQFERNSFWYSSTEAKAHLLKKLDHVEGKTGLQTAEEFIEKVASASSASGKAYKVRCAGAAAVESGPWLRSQLQELRASTKAQGQ